MSLLSIPSRLAVLAMLLALLFFGAARAETSDVETTWRLLDYIAVDYAGAVSHGAVSSPSEYAEQNEFAATVAAKLAGLPPKPERQTLLAEAARLQRAIADKADAEQVAGIARGLAAELLAAYPVPLAPKKVPTSGAARRCLARIVRPATAKPAAVMGRTSSSWIRRPSPSRTRTAHVNAAYSASTR